MFYRVRDIDTARLHANAGTYLFLTQRRRCVCAGAGGADALLYIARVRGGSTGSGGGSAQGFGR